MNLNRKEFLEILRDYLKKDFHEGEVNDIIRDYEEYFVNGTIEGKSDMEIITSLGSPKYIAEEMVAQIKEKDDSKPSKKDRIFEKIEEIKVKLKNKYNKAKNYISKKLTPDLEGNGNSLSRKVIKLVLVMLSMFLLIPAFMFVMFMISYLLVMISLIAAYLFSIPFIIKFTQIVPNTGLFIIFASMAFIGVEIILWQIFIFIMRIGKRLLKNYIHWLKTRGIYINALKKKEKLYDEDLYYDEETEYKKGDDLDE